MSDPKFSLINPTLAIQIHPVKSGEILGLAPMPGLIPSHIYIPLPQLTKISPSHNPPQPPNISRLAVGTQFLSQSSPSCSEVLLQVVGHTSIPHQPHSLFIPLLQAKTDLKGGTYHLTYQRQGYALATITLSDQGASGKRQDESCVVITNLITNTLNINHYQNFILPDEPRQLAGLVMDLALNQGYDLIISTGGTGLSPRDTTPEAISHLLERRLPIFEQAMAQASLAKTPTAILSRAVAGTLGQALVLTLPGSKKAVAENLTALLPGLNHALAKLQGETADCGNIGYENAEPAAIIAHTSNPTHCCNPDHPNPKDDSANYNPPEFPCQTMPTQDSAAHQPLIKICYLKKAEEVYLAKGQGLSYATPMAVGLDLRAILPQAAELNILPGQRISLSTGLSLEPESSDLAGFIYSRSGLGAIQGLTVAQGVGVIDPDYRGEIQVVILNTSQQSQSIKHGDRIAQLVFQPILRVSLQTVAKLNPTARGAGGFGHTGKA